MLALAALAAAAWIASGFVLWKRCTIVLPDGSGSVVYMARVHKIPFAEWDRKVRIETDRFPPTTKWVPDDTGGGDPVKVYWYPAQDHTGPYVRFQDPLGEYLVDMRRGVTLFIVSRSGKSARVAEMRSGKSALHYRDDPATGKIVATLNGRPIRRLEHRVAAEPGLYIGRIEYPFNRFVSAKEVTEEPLPKY